jgi:hypothetical protein
VQKVSFAIVVDEEWLRKAEVATSELFGQPGYVVMQ